MQDAEPLLDLIDPRAMDGGEMELEARMFLKPFLSLFAVMGTDIVANDVNQSNLGWGGLIHVLKEGDEFLLPFTSEALACDMPGSCIEGGKEVKGSIPSVLMFDTVGDISGLCWLCGTNPWPRLKRGFLLDTQYDLLGSKRAAVEVNDLSNGLIESCISGMFWAQPQVVTPWL